MRALLRLVITDAIFEATQLPFDLGHHQVNRRVHVLGCFVTFYDQAVVQRDLDITVEQVSALRREDNVRLDRIGEVLVDPLQFLAGVVLEDLARVDIPKCVGKPLMVGIGP